MRLFAKIGVVKLSGATRFTTYCSAPAAYT